jgi:glucose/mannose-6-phosphate isomerase
MQDLIDQLDNSNVLGSITALPDQIEHAWHTVSLTTYPDLSSTIHQIILMGMGGSALGGRVIKSIFQDQLSYPFEIINNYHLPAYANSSSLIILSSYSGTTEEILSAAHEAQAKKIPTVVIAAGGPLLDLAQKNHLPYYQIEPQYNPSNQPRMAIGYTITGTLALLHQLKLLDISKADFDQVISILKSNVSKYSPTISDNFAIKLAQSLLTKTINLVSCDHLTGAVHVVNNQLNENAKHLTAEFIVPELNHHYLEALSFPTSAKQTQAYLIFNSDLYLPPNQTRMSITQNILEKADYSTYNFKAQSPTKLSQAFEVIQFGAYLNFYLAMLEGIDPAPIPSVDYFKSELKKTSN